MFQRQNQGRQAGFIRRHKISRVNSANLPQDQIQIRYQKTQQFSPFRIRSPEPIERIFQTYQAKEISAFQQLIHQFRHPKEPEMTRSHKKKQKKHRFQKTQNSKKNFQRPVYELTEQHQQIQHYQQPPRYSKNNHHKHRKQAQNHEKFQKIQRQRKSKHPIVTQVPEQVQQIHYRPQQTSLSLAEAFDLHCHKMKERLERQRIRFSKSHKINPPRQHSQSAENISFRKNNHSFRNSVSNAQIFYDNHHHQKSNHIPKLQHRNSDADTRDTARQINKRGKMNQNNQNKQNYQPNSMRLMKTQRVSVELQSTKFFIPTGANRAKPITPKQAYEHSLKKWKQLPEVVAKQKEKQKQAKMRERISKMKAHSLSVRSKLKRY